MLFKLEDEVVSEVFGADELVNCPIDEVIVHADIVLVVDHVGPLTVICVLLVLVGVELAICQVQDLSAFRGVYSEIDIYSILTVAPPLFFQLFVFLIVDVRHSWRFREHRDIVAQLQAVAELGKRLLAFLGYVIALF